MKIQIIMETLPSELIRTIFSFVRPVWLMMCNKEYMAKTLTPRRRSLIQWMRLKRIHEKSCARIKQLKKEKIEIQGNAIIRHFREKDALDDHLYDINEEMNDLREYINRIHRSIQLVTHQLSYPISHLYARWDSCHLYQN